MVQVPVVTKVNTPPAVIVHTPVVDELNVGERPDDAEADSCGFVANVLGPGLAKVMD